jgi:hypothetical protein
MRPRGSDFAGAIGVPLIAIRELDDVIWARRQCDIHPRRCGAGPALETDVRPRSR